MNMDSYTKGLITVFTFALLLNGLNPWINPTSASAKDEPMISEKSNGANCSSASKNSIKSLEAVNGVERLLGYIESSVNDIKLTVNGIDRKMNHSPASRSPDRK